MIWTQDAVIYYKLNYYFISTEIYEIFIIFLFKAKFSEKKIININKKKNLVKTGNEI